MFCETLAVAVSVLCCLAGAHQGSVERQDLVPFDKTGVYWPSAISARTRYAWRLLLLYNAVSMT